MKQMGLNNHFKRVQIKDVKNAGNKVSTMNQISQMENTTVTAPEDLTSTHHMLSLAQSPQH